MSFLARLSARNLPVLSRMPTVMPKGLAARHSAPLYREAAPPEEEPEIAPRRAPARGPLRREEAPSGENEEMARAPAEPPENEPEVQPARLSRASEEPPGEQEEAVAPLRRAPQENEEEAVAPLRRATQENEQEVAPLRRAAAPEEPEEEPAAQPMRTVRRAEEVPLDDGEKPLRQPFQADLVPGAMPAHPGLANEEMPSDLQALRRDVAPPRQASAATAPPTPAAPRGADAWLPHPVPDWTGADAGFAPEAPAFEAGSFAPAPASGRAQIVIDQLDVLIHEPAAAQPSRAQADHSRLMRARYLRRL